MTAYEKTYGSCETPLKTSSDSNLARFLDRITPVVPAVHLNPKQRRVWDLKEDDLGIPTQYFRLKDLWEFFKEPSAYGLSVTVDVDGKQSSVVQHYVPYLSALQLYTATTNNVVAVSSSLDQDLHSTSPHLRLRTSTGEEDDDSNGSEMAARGDISSSSTSSSPRSSSFMSCKSDEKSTLWESLSDEFASEHEVYWAQKSRLGHLWLDYFERDPPCTRVPLLEKIDELSRRHPELRELTSRDLSAASWMSVAWYPIYSIPSNHNSRDLSTSFLTFHTLSSCFLDEDYLKGNHGNEFPRSPSSEIQLEPFGLATYKLRGDVWLSGGSEDQERLHLLWQSAISWQNQLQIYHHDCQFFLNHRN